MKPVIRTRASMPRVTASAPRRGASGPSPTITRRAAGCKPSVEPRPFAVGMDDIFSFRPDQLEHGEESPGADGVRPDADETGAAPREPAAVGAPRRARHRHRKLLPRETRDDFADLGGTAAEAGRDEKLEDTKGAAHSCA